MNTIKNTKSETTLTLITVLFTNQHASSTLCKATTKQSDSILDQIWEKIFLNEIFISAEHKTT